MRIGVVVLGLAALAGLSGCGSGGADTIEGTVSAAGVLTYQGQPLADHQVTFHPTDGRRAATGRTDAAGKFVLGTNQTTDGAPVGAHKVTVVYDPEVDMGEPGKETFAPPPPPKVKIPQKYAGVESTDLLIEIPAAGSSDLKIELN